MKKEIHPNWNKESKVLFNGQQIMTVGSTKEELNVEIWSGNHPFYTGKQILVDTDNLVDKFNKKLELSQSLAGKVRSKKIKRAQRDRSAVRKDAVTLKDMLKNLG